MFKGKKRCKILKEIRKQIAENNDIEFITSECKHQGDCLGTCPKCEEEVRYLERELEKRQRMGLAITVAGLALTLTGVAAGAVACEAQERASQESFRSIRGRIEEQSAFDDEEFDL